MCSCSSRWKETCRASTFNGPLQNILLGSYDKGEKQLNIHTENECFKFQIFVVARRQLPIREVGKKKKRFVVDL